MMDFSLPCLMFKIPNDKKSAWWFKPLISPVLESQLINSRCLVDIGKLTLSSLFLGETKKTREHLGWLHPIRRCHWHCSTSFYISMVYPHNPGIGDIWWISWWSPNTFGRVPSRWNPVGLCRFLCAPRGVSRRRFLRRWVAVTRHELNCGWQREMRNPPVDRW